MEFKDVIQEESAKVLIKISETDKSNCVTEETGEAAKKITETRSQNRERYRSQTDRKLGISESYQERESSILQQHL